MAYILGYVYADGSLEDASYLRGKYLRLTSGDRTIIEAIKKALGSKHKIVKLLPTTKNGKDRYFLRIGDHIIYNDLISLGVTTKKSLNMQFPKCVPLKFMNDFIRGYFDGDGTFFLEKRQNGVIPLVVFTSGSKSFLGVLSGILATQCNLGETKKVYNSHRSYQLRYSARKAKEILKFIFSEVDDNTLSLDRKYNLYQRFKLSIGKRRRAQVA